MKTLLGLDTEELCELVQELGEPAYRGKQLAEWIYGRGAQMFDEMTNLPDTLRVALGREYVVGRSAILAEQRSKDGTIKLLLALKNGGEIIPLRKRGNKGDFTSTCRKTPLNLPLQKGETSTLRQAQGERDELINAGSGDEILRCAQNDTGNLIETVGIPYADRFSCCLSTQVGCPVGCVFCATGLGGFSRNLTAGEIVDQVLSVQEAAGGRRVDHVVFMGMGEPLLNYEATLKAMRLLNREMGIAMRHLTVSTVGYVPGIRRLAEEKLQVTLAVSLHAGTDKLRRRLVPGMKFSLGEIVEACKIYLRRTGRRVTFEYCLLDGVNDGTEEAQALARLLKGMNCHVNLIPYSPVTGLDFRTRSRKRVKALREVLEVAGIQVTQRLQRGADIDAACGQLKTKS